MYTLSKDYEKLYELICQGHIAACFVDYSYRDDSKPFRDIAKIRRFEEYDIQVGARGIEYGSIRTFHKEEGTEKQLFIQQCQRMNLEWIDDKFNNDWNHNPDEAPRGVKILFLVKDDEDVCFGQVGDPYGDDTGTDDQFYDLTSQSHDGDFYHLKKDWIEKWKLAI